MREKKQIECDIVLEYKRQTSRKLLIIGILIIIMLILCIISLNVGSYDLNFIDIISALFNSGEEVNKVIIWNIRMPRVIAALLAGAGLALSGCIMQNVLKNPMASPSTLGVSNAAVFGANFALIALGAGSISSAQGVMININNPYITTICAFIWALCSILLIILLTVRKKFSPEVVVLAGITLGLLFSALTTILQYFASDTALSSAVLWSFGDLRRATHQNNLIMFIVIAVAFGYFYCHRIDYNSMSSGSDVAKSLGVRVESLRFLSLFLSSLICSVCVSFLGIIGFVGLIAPHMIKKIIGNDHRYLIPASCITGAVLLLVADIVSRIIFTNISLPVGAITSIIGSPLFMWLLLKKKRGSL